MLYSLLRPMLFSLDAERAHRMGSRVMRHLAAHRPLAEWMHVAFVPTGADADRRRRPRFSQSDRLSRRTG